MTTDADLRAAEAQSWDSAFERNPQIDEHINRSFKKHKIDVKHLRFDLQR